MNSILFNPLKKKKKKTPAPLQRSLISSRLPAKVDGFSSQLDEGVKLRSIRQIKKDVEAGKPDALKLLTERNLSKSTITQTTNMTSKMN